MANKLVGGPLAVLVSLNKWLFFAALTVPLNVPLNVPP